MKNFIGTLLIPFVIFLKFGELNATGNAGPNSSRLTGRGGWRPGSGSKPRPKITPAAVRIPARPHNTTVKYMDKEIHFWLTEDQRLEQASFSGMDTDNKSAQRVFGVLIFVDVLLGRKMVVYMLRNGKILSVRAPKPRVNDSLEPSHTEWYIANSRNTWRLHVNPVQIPSVEGYPFPIYHYEPVSIELAVTGNKRLIQPHDVIKNNEYPLGMRFCSYALHAAKEYPLLMGGFFPQPGVFVNNVELVC